jgi:hypothetical protein
VGNSTPIKLYNPEEAKEAMKKGRILRNEKGDNFFYKTDPDTDHNEVFLREDKNGTVWTVADPSEFFGLYEEAKYV